MKAYINGVAAVYVAQSGNGGATADTILHLSGRGLRLRCVGCDGHEDISRDALLKSDLSASFLLVVTDLGIDAQLGNSR